MIIESGGRSWREGLLLEMAVLGNYFLMVVKGEDKGGLVPWWNRKRQQSSPLSLNFCKQKSHKNSVHVKKNSLEENQAFEEKY